MASTRLIAKNPKSCTKAELQDFIAMVCAGGEVNRSGLDARVDEAKSLVFLFQGRCLKGIAALKKPSRVYRCSVACKADVNLEPSAFPYELGYVFVLPSARGAHLSRPLVTKALAAADGVGVFATTRTENKAMRRTLGHCGFAPHGCPYGSERGKYELQLFIRAATQPAVP
jgi:hypothetical protein